MKSWVFTFRVEPPVNKTVLVRFGQTAFDAAYSKLLDQWYMLCPGGTEEKICEPPMWFCDQEWAKTHQRDPTKPRLISTGLRRQKPQAEFSF